VLACVRVCLSVLCVSGSGSLAKLVLRTSVDGCAGAMDYCFTAPDAATELQQSCNRAAAAESFLALRYGLLLYCA